MSNSLWPHTLYSPWNSPGQKPGVGNLSFLQGIFPTQGLNPGLLHFRQIPYQLSHKRSPRILKWVAYPFSSRSSWPRNQTGVSCTAGGFFTNWAIREAQDLGQTNRQIKHLKNIYIISHRYYRFAFTEIIMAIWDRLLCIIAHGFWDLIQYWYQGATYS